MLWSTSRRSIRSLWSCQLASQSSCNSHISSTTRHHASYITQRWYHILGTNSNNNNSNNNNNNSDNTGMNGLHFQHQYMSEEDQKQLLDELYALNDHVWRVKNKEEKPMDGVKYDQFLVKSSDLFGRTVIHILSTSLLTYLFLSSFLLSNLSSFHYLTLPSCSRDLVNPLMMCSSFILFLPFTSSLASTSLSLHTLLSSRVLAKSSSLLGEQLLISLFTCSVPSSHLSVHISLSSSPVVVYDRCTYTLFSGASLFDFL